MTPTYHKDHQSQDIPERLDKAIALVVVVLAGWMILYFGFFNTSDTSSVELDTALITDNRLLLDTVHVGDKQYIPVAAEEYNAESVVAPVAIARKKVTGLHNGIATIATVDNGSSSSANQPIPPSSIDSHYSDSTAIGVAAAGSTPEATMPDAGTNAADTAIVEQEEVVTTEQTTAVPSIEKTTSEQHATSASSETGSCVIVVGAYGRKANVSRMSDRLRAAGYDVFTAPHKGVTRVGIYQPCHTSRITETLRIVRRDYAKDATILAPAQ